MHFNGLNDQEVEQSRRTNGSNAIPDSEPTTFWAEFKETFGDPMIKILLAIAAIMIIMFAFGYSDIYEPVGTIVAVLIVAVVSAKTGVASDTKYRQLKDSTKKDQCKVYRNGVITVIDVDDVVLGDKVLLQSGDKIPADGILVAGDLRVDNSALNGEAEECSKTAAAEDGTSLYLLEGDKLTLMTGLYGTMLRSGNDAAVAIAEHTAGSVKKFVKMMNAKAKELGMTHSHFSWPNGLIDEDNYSSAKDMAILSSYAMKNKLFAKIVKTGYIETKDGYQIENHNRMLSRDKRCIGVKTGFTTLAGRTLVTCFKNPDNGQRIVIVTLNNYDHYNDHERLCNWVFDNFQQTTLVKKNSKVATVTDNGKTAELVAKQKVTWPSKDGEASRITSTFSVQSNQGVPMEEGDVAGVMRFYLDGKKIGQTKLLYHYPES